MEDPAEGDWHDAWETVQRGHAIANSVYVAAANRVGWEEDLKFWGSSFVCDSFGKIVARASSSAEEVLIAELDLVKNELVREGWGFFRNRRPDVYWPLIEMVKADGSTKRARRQLDSVWRIRLCSSATTCLPNGKSMLPSGSPGPMTRTHSL